MDITLQVMISVQCANSESEFDDWSTQCSNSNREFKHWIRINQKTSDEAEDFKFCLVV